MRSTMKTLLSVISMMIHNKKLLKTFILLFISIKVSSQDLIYWQASDLNTTGVLEQFQQIVTRPASPVKKTQQKPVNIALIYPSNDVSDFWVRNYKAFTARLDELGIYYTTKIFPSKQIEHSLQTLYVNKVLKQSQDFDYVIFGPSELNTQAVNIKKLASSTDFVTFIWAFHTPIKAWENQPRAWFDFSSSVGANKLCNFLIDKFGADIEFIMNRGIPGITDMQRSGGFKACVEAKGNWKVLYEHFGQYQQYGGYDGANVALEFFPTTQVLHNANTAMAVGAVEAYQASERLNKIFITGWGGTQIELEMIKKGELNATPMRMGDDVGVASAEAIKLLLDKRDEEVPSIYLGRVTIASDDMSIKALEELEKEAFRYSNSLNETTTKQSK